MASFLERLRGKSGADAEEARRLPPGQVLTRKWPVLTYGATPRVDLATWSFRCFGLVEQPMTWTWQEFQTLGSAAVDCDLHCVTHWTLLDNHFEGVSLKRLLEVVKPKAEAKYVLVHADPDYTTNIALADLDDDAVLLATRWNGAPLEPDHGGPCRLLAPKLYLWKSAKWVRGLEFLDVNVPGFWEDNGYHMHADPWAEERYADQETHAMQQMRAEASRRISGR